MANRLHPLQSLGNIPAERGDIRVERLEFRLKPKVPFPHKHDFYQIVVIDQGRGTHQVDFSQYKVSAQQIYILKPGQVHAWEFHEKSRGYLIEFTIESLTTSSLVHSADFIQSIQSLPDEAVLKKELYQKLRPYFEQMAEETLHPGKNSALYQQSHLTLILVELLRLERRDHPPQPRSYSETVLQFNNLVEVHYKKEQNLEFYAKHLKLSPKTLAERIRKNLGMSPKEVIQNRRLLEAKRLLAYTETSVAEIGYALGFEDPNYFSRFFKQETKLNPQSFRDRRRGAN